MVTMTTAEEARVAKVAAADGTGGGTGKEAEGGKGDKEDKKVDDEDDDEWVQPTTPVAPIVPTAAAAAAAAAVEEFKNEKVGGAADARAIVFDADSGCLEFEAPLLRSFWTPILTNITNCIRDMLRKVDGCPRFYVVGGAAESEIVQAHFAAFFDSPEARTKTGEWRYCRPSKASLAIVAGAVIYGMERSKSIEARFTKHAYAWEASSPTTAADRAAGRRVTQVQKQSDRAPVDYCKTLRFFVKSGVLIKTDEERWDLAHPLQDHQTHVSFDIFRCSDDAVYQDHPGTVKVGTLTASGVREQVYARGAASGVLEACYNRDIRIGLQFGGAEIQVHAHTAEGRTCQAAINWDA
jgi:hypothetical protein